MVTVRNARPVDPTRLMQAHELLTRERPAVGAGPEAWLAFYRRSAALYAEVAEVDRGHHHEALYWSSREERKHARSRNACASPRGVPAVAPSAAFPVVDRRVVPYVTSWSEEIDPPYRLVEVPGRGIAYADETLSDRDEHGVLWFRTLFQPGLGHPQFGKVHPFRQRRAMRRLLCQVCGGPADRTEGGVLWLIRDYRDDWPGWPNRMGENEPPVCLPCVRLSVRVCPALRKGAVLVRAGRYEVAGVHGGLYTGGRTPLPVGPATVSFEDPAIRWVRAVSLVRELLDCTLIELDELGC